MDPEPETNNHSIREAFKMLSRVIPPLFLFWVAFLPFDMGAALVHLGALAAFVWSVVSIIKTLAQRSLDKTERNQRLIRPALTIVVIGISMQLLSVSYQRAEAFVRNAAAVADRECKEKKGCPDTLAGFACHEGQCRTVAGLTAKYQVRYYRAEDKQSFKMFLRKNIDNSFCMEGGVAKQQKFSQKCGDR